MNYRTALLHAAEDLGASGTKTIDIDISKPISRIEFTYKTTKGSVAMAAPAPANISKIELVDGSKPLHSLTGYENQALAYYSRPGISMEHGQHVNTLSEFDNYSLDFGRWLWDELLAFDPTRFTNPQLKVTFNEATSDASASAGTLEAWAHVFDEKVVSPMGFLSAIEHFSYTIGAADSYETIELPEDRIIRQMLVRAYQDGYEPWYNIDEARFDEGTMDRIPWEYTSLESYFRRMQSHWPMIRTPFQAVPSGGGRVFYVPQTEYWSSLNLFPASATATYYTSSASMRGGKVTLVGAEVQAIGEALGYLPWHCFQFPMGMKDNIDDWYDPAGKKPRLRLRCGTTGGTGQVVLEELYKY